MLSSTGTAGQLHSCMIRNASSKRVPVVTVGMSRRMTSPTRIAGSVLRNAAIKSWRVRIPATFPASLSTGKTCCDVASHASTASSEVTLSRSDRAASKQKTDRNDQVHRRTRRCDDQFLDRLFRHALQTRDPADRQQRNIRRVDAKGLRGKGMTEFVQNDAHKQEHDHQNS